MRNGSHDRMYGTNRHTISPAQKVTKAGERSGESHPPTETIPLSEIGRESDAMNESGVTHPSSGRKRFSSPDQRSGLATQDRYSDTNSMPNRRDIGTSLHDDGGGRGGPAIPSTNITGNLRPNIDPTHSVGTKRTAASESPASDVDHGGKTDKIQIKSVDNNPRLPTRATPAVTRSRSKQNQSDIGQAPLTRSKSKRLGIHINSLYTLRRKLGENESECEQIHIIGSDDSTILAAKAAIDITRLSSHSIPTPATYEEAVNSKFAAEWLKSIAAENESISACGV